MTKIELAREVATSENLHLSTAVIAIDGFLRVVKETLVRGEDVTLRGFGTLTVVKREERKALHFQTKEPVTVPAHNTVKLRISKELKEMLNNGTVD